MSYKPKHKGDYHAQTDLANYTRLLRAETNYYNVNGREMDEERKTFLEEGNVKEMLRENVHRFQDLPLNMMAVLPLELLGTYTKEKTLTELKQLSTTLSELMVNLFGLRYDNAAKLVLSYQNKLFSLGLYPEVKGYSLRLYDHTGFVVLYDTEIRGQYLPMDVLAKIKERAELFYHEQIPCSECETPIREHEKAGWFGACTFCTTCWEDKGWKKRAAAGL